MSTRLFPILAVTVFCSFGVLGAQQISEEQFQKLFNEEASLEEFTKAAEEAAKAGVSSQILAEAKLIWGLGNENPDYLTKILPELEVAAKNFKPEDSATITNPDEFNGFISYIRALEAKKRGDEAALKKHVSEALWLNPDQADTLGDTISQFRREQLMAKVTIDMKLPITTSKGEATTLADQLGNNKAILLDFWATWCGPCINLMPELRKNAELLKKHGIVVAGMNNESDEAKADEMRAKKDMKMPWLVEPKGSPFSEQLGIDSIPRMILLSPEGKVLYNGHPKESGLWEALKKLDSTIKEPKED
ncbi:thiol-disulfide isomerase/thioredoxin [Roseimicrobium gellanilyticum]|uniref:Thiol-disulfide isomerase/thioredoxin n=1 Tax=Roseimicrobium gellanilyticum TaxID=748857 RepID=A0A366H6B0_9BACT|nr:redoxin family protein [Roseimicrobium gellanilyticum]RBP37658.1 thiol-disulfide isomerase/thioredoxin [Roseimicrobium gellanilyticum]